MLEYIKYALNGVNFGGWGIGIFLVIVLFFMVMNIYSVDLSWALFAMVEMMWLVIAIEAVTDPINITIFAVVTLFAAIYFMVQAKED